MTNIEPTLFDIAAQLTEIKQGQGQIEIKQQIDRIETRFDSIDKRFTNWDNRLADLSRG
ncbi:hypothetical protein [Nostoc sp.]|uniref:hypothetical protein n=1 Tax=Nostoc sp. TaxID=1180 RepID=UPI0035941B03